MQCYIQEDLPWVCGEVQPATAFWAGCSREGLIGYVSRQEFKASFGKEIRIQWRRHEKSRWVEGSEEEQKTIPNVDDVITLLHLWGCNGITTASAVMIGKEIFIGGYKGSRKCSPGTGTICSAKVVMSNRICIGKWNWTWRLRLLWAEFSPLCLCCQLLRGEC